MDCPYCGTEAERDEVDNGVGMEAAGPWGCPRCHAVELDLFDQPTNEDEARTGWRR